MLGLFEKKKDPRERAAKCLEKKDWDGLSRAYYDMGVAAMESRRPKQRRPVAEPGGHSLQRQR